MAAEGSLEKSFVRQCKKHKIRQRKFKTPGHRNAPDRIMFLCWAETWLIEFKAPGKKPNRGQLHEHETLRQLGYRVEVIDNREDMMGIIDEAVQLSKDCN